MKTFEKLKKEHTFTRDQEKQLRKLKNKLSKIETEIDTLEEEITAIDLELAENYDEVSNTPNFFENYKAKKAALASLMSDWESVEEEIEKFS